MTLSSLLKKCIFALFLVLPLLNASATGFPDRGLNGAPLSLYPTVTGIGYRHCFINPASLSYAMQPAAGISYYSRYGVSELSIKSLSLIIPNRNGAFGFNYSNRGFSELMYHNFSVSSGLRLSDNISLGVEAGIDAASSPATDSRYITATCEAGVIVVVTKTLRVGLHLVNPVPNSLREYPLSSSAGTGAEIILSDYVSVSVLVEKSSRQPVSFSTGFNYQVTDEIQVRTGFSTSTKSFGFSFAYRFGSYDTELSFLSHTRLGISSLASVFGVLGR
jgi:hypothetical protein